MASARNTDTRLRLSEEQATLLASRFGTPLYVVGEAHFRERIRRYKAAFQAAVGAAWEGRASSRPQSESDDAAPELSYASKANSTLALLAIAHQEGCGIDVASEGEFRAALAAGVPASRCHFHGSNKGLEELRFAIEKGIGQIIVDNNEEIGKLKDLGPNVEILLRLAPGVDPITHHKISTGQADTKFGFNIANGSAEAAVRACLGAGLHLIGFHCHVGSQLLEPEAQCAGGEALAHFASQMKAKHGFETKLLNVGGGLGVAYTDEDQPIPVEEYCRMVVESVKEGLCGSGLAPRLGQEPGRALVAESGVTLYRVGVIKRVPTRDGERVYVGVDGGLSDNPRPALYDSRYTVEKIGAQSGEKMTVTVSGRHCETDTLFKDVELPYDLKQGDLIQVLCTGAYNSAMASNYNRYPRPATVLIRMDGRFSLVQERDAWEGMFARESVPGDLRGAR